MNIVLQNLQQQQKQNKTKKNNNNNNNNLTNQKKYKRGLTNTREGGLASSKEQSKERLTI